MTHAHVQWDLTVQQECVVQAVALQKSCGLVQGEVLPGEAGGGTDDEWDHCASQPDGCQGHIDSHCKSQKVQRQ